MNKFIALAAVSAAALAAVPAAAQTVTAPVGGRVEALVGYDRIKVGDFGKDNGAVFGVGAGYDFAVGGNASVGVDIEATESTVKEGDDFANVKAARDLYAGGRASFGIADNANVYVKAGYTNFRVKGEFEGVSESENLDGWRLGGGAQFGIGGKAYAGGEYRYSNYENDVSRHQLVATVGTRF